jgi:hypothetical protein
MPPPKVESRKGHPKLNFGREFFKSSEIDMKPAEHFPRSFSPEHIISQFANSILESANPMMELARKLDSIFDYFYIKIKSDVRQCEGEMNQVKNTDTVRDKYQRT